METTTINPGRDNFTGENPNEKRTITVEMTPSQWIEKRVEFYAKNFLLRKEQITAREIAIKEKSIHVNQIYLRQHKAMK